MRLDRELIETGLPPGPAAEVAHYTAIGSLVSMLPYPTPSGLIGWTSAWASPVQFLNDRAELVLGLNVLLDVAASPPRSAQLVLSTIEALLAAGTRADTDAYQMSFSGNADELGQWRGYADNGLGCALVSDTRSVYDVADVAGWVIYDPRKQRAFAKKVLEALRKQTDVDFIEQALVAAASYMKHDGFEAEQEYRLLVFPAPESVRFRAREGRLTPYVDLLDRRSSLPVYKVLVGPGWSHGVPDDIDPRRNHVVQGIMRLLDAVGLHDTEVTYSRLPYDPK